MDHSFVDLSLAALYDGLNSWGPGDEFYLKLVRRADAVLDVGCGTGQLLCRARAEGHRGRLVGLDPAAAMLVQARQARTDVEWVLGDTRARGWDGEFDLAVMTGHAFQVLLGDEDVLQCLRAVRRALGPGGRFAFETRNPAARPWERWTPDRVREVTAPDGAVVRVRHEVQDGGLRDGRVRFSETYESDRWPAPHVSHTVLRFLDAGELGAFLTAAGLTVVEQYGDWDGGPLTPAAPEIITVATPAA